MCTTTPERQEPWGMAGLTPLSHLCTCIESKGGGSTCADRAGCLHVLFAPNQVQSLNQVTQPSPKTIHKDAGRVPSSKGGAPL